MTNWIKVDNPYKVGKCPVEPYIVVDVKDRTGKITEGVEARSILWHNRYSSFDIVEYRIRKDPKKEYEVMLISVHYGIKWELLHDNLVVLNDRIVKNVEVRNGELVVTYRDYGFENTWSTQGSRLMTQEELLSMFKVYKEITND